MLMRTPIEPRRELPRGPKDSGAEAFFVAVVIAIAVGAMTFALAVLFGPDIISRKSPPIVQIGP